jgi:glyoxylase-like metal-dependent hydrolase (beta-lactamase superfamily II)
MASKVDLHIIVAPVFATNCCVLVSEQGDALIVDAGAGVASAAIELVEINGWHLVGVAATHGHADHTWDAGQVCAHFKVPFYIHQADAYRLDDPIGTLQTPGTRPDQSVAVAIAHAVRVYALGEYQKPAQVQTFGPNNPINSGRLSSELTNPGRLSSECNERLSKPPATPSVEQSRESSSVEEAQSAVSKPRPTNAALKTGSIELDLIFAPGHTEGSTFYIADGLALSGDVLFAGSIGRTDLPGGDQAIMDATLKRLAKELDPALKVIPGHGPATTVAKELNSNPYWRNEAF